MRVLVIGGSGYLGQEICQALLNRGYEVRTLQRRASQKLHEWQIPQSLGSLEQEALVDEVMAGCQAVIHCGGKVDLTGLRNDFFKVNYDGLKGVLRSALRHKIKAFILTSTPSVFLNSKGICGLAEEELSYSTIDVPYVQSKIAAEKLILTLHRELMPFVILRPHQIWSEKPNRFTRELKLNHAHLKIWGDGLNRVDSIHVKDAARAHIQALEALLQKPELVSGKDYNLSSSRPFLLWEQINKFYRQEGLSPIEDRVAVSLQQVLLSWGRLWERSDWAALNYTFIQMSVDRWFDCTRAWRDFGFQPTRFQ